VAVFIATVNACGVYPQCNEGYSLVRSVFQLSMLNHELKLSGKIVLEYSYTFS
jgi:hypothetical protein